MKKLMWLWITLALLAGFGIGLYYSWEVSPVRYSNTIPRTLRSDFKDQFRMAIASAYAATHDINRAKARLALLGDADTNQALTAQAQRMLAANEPLNDVQQIAQLAADLQNGVAQIPPTNTATVAVSQIAVTQTEAAPGSDTDTPAPPIFDTPTLESTPEILATPTLRPTHTAVPTLGAPYVLVKQDTVCNPNLTDGLMQITVIDKHNRQIAGAEIIIRWDGGEEDFFTGLKPEIANGYADYVMQAGISYSVRVEQSGTPATNLTAPSCTDSSGQTYTGGLHLTFQQP
jgi:hypothetical protein